MKYKIIGYKSRNTTTMYFVMGKIKLKIKKLKIKSALL
tara:strand:- start:2105 stop:2218 length:114 start_codon:yes stop_codon:yes gene_type:complete